MTLYDLTADYLELQEMMEDDISDDALLDSMESIEGLYEDKIDGYEFCLDAACGFDGFCLDLIHKYPQRKNRIFVQLIVQFIYYQNCSNNQSIYTNFL